MYLSEAVAITDLDLWRKELRLAGIETARGTYPRVLYLYTRHGIMARYVLYCGDRWWRLKAKYV